MLRSALAELRALLRDAAAPTKRALDRPDDLSDLFKREGLASVSSSAEMSRSNRNCSSR
jgi:hypothetical protein